MKKLLANESHKLHILEHEKHSPFQKFRIAVHCVIFAQRISHKRSKRKIKPL